MTLDEYDLDRPISDVHDFYRNFCAALDGREELLIRSKEVRKVLWVMELVFESARIGQVIRIENKRNV